MWPVKKRVQWVRNRHLKSHDDLGLATTPPPTNKKNRYNTLMSGLRCLHRYSFALTLLAGLALMAAGCRMATPAPVRENVHAADDLAANEQQIRLRIRALVEPYSGSIVETADRIRAGTTNRAIRREALLWKIEAVPALREALFRPNPLVAIGDTWVLIWQMTDYFEKGRGKQALGAASPDRGDDLQVPGKRACRRGRFHYALRRCVPCPELHYAMGRRAPYPAFHCCSGINAEPSLGARD